MGSWFALLGLGRLLPHAGGKGQKAGSGRRAGKLVAKPDSRVFSAEFTFTALEIGDSVPM
jgi:hypothetical protein